MIREVSKHATDVDMAKQQVIDKLVTMQINTPPAYNKEDVEILRSSVKKRSKSGDFSEEQSRFILNESSPTPRIK